MIKPIPTTCIAISLEIPNTEQARGISISEPPAIPEVPHAQTTAAIHIRREEPKSTSIPKVLTAAIVITTMVTAAPDILMVQPRGIEIEYDSRGTPNFSHKAMLTGMLAADDLVKNAVRPE